MTTVIRYRMKVRARLSTLRCERCLGDNGAGMMTSTTSSAILCLGSRAEPRHRVILSNLDDLVLRSRMGGTVQEPGCSPLHDLTGRYGERAPFSRQSFHGKRSTVRFRNWRRRASWRCSREAM